MHNFLNNCGLSETLISDNVSTSCNQLVKKYMGVYSYYYINKRLNATEIVAILLNLFVRLSDCHTMPNFLYAIVSFIKDIQGIIYLEFKNKYEDFLIYSIMSIFAIKMCKVDSTYSVAQDSTGDVKSFLENLRLSLSNYNKIKNSDFGKKFSNLCAMIICSPFCVRAGIDSTWFGFSDIFHRRLVYEQTNKENFDLVYDVFDTTTYLLDKLILWCETKSYHFLYVDDLEIAEYEKSYEKLAHYSDKFALLANQGMTVRDYLNECDLTIERGKKLKDFYANDRFKSAALKSQQSSLARFKMRAYDKLQVNSKRDAPISFCLFGPPGIGKSSLLDKILHGLYLNDIKLGVTSKKYDPDMKYIFNEDDEFMSEFKASHEVCVMDDVDQFSDKINEAKEGGSVAKSIYFINPVPYVTAQAALEDKGMIPFLCRYVVMTTNTYDAGISKVFRQEGGAYRRFVFIEVKVKPDYCKPGETQLKGDTSETGYMNHEMHDFWVRKYVSNGSKSNAVYWDKDTRSWSSGGSGYKPAMSLAELLHFYLTEIQTPHYKQSSLTKVSLDHFFESELCVRCDVPTCICSCSKAQSVWDIKRNNDYVLDTIGVSSILPGLSNLYCSYVLFMLFYWYLVHLVISFCWSKNRPNFATYNVLYYVECLPDSRQLPFVVRWLPRGLKAYCLCEGWITFFTNIAKTVNNCGCISFSNKIKMKQYYDKYKVGGFLALVGSLYYMYNTYKSVAYSSPQEECKPYVDDKEKDNSKNPWSVSFAPISKMVDAKSTVTFDQLVTACRFNVARLVCDSTETNMFFINSNRALMPKHTYLGLQNSFPLKVDIVFHNESNIGMNRSILIDESNFIEMDLPDVILFSHNSLLPMRDLSKFLLDSKMTGKSKGIILPRMNDGSLRPVVIDGFTSDYVHYYWRKKYIVLKNEGYASWSKTETLAGDCGAPYIINTPSGCFIAGIHIAGRPEPKIKMWRAECHMVLKKDLIVDDKRFMPTCREELNLNSIYVTDKDLSIVQSVHPSSVVNGLNGIAAVYGDIPSYPHRKMKSQVDRTLIAQDVKGYFKLDNYTHFSPKAIKSSIAAKQNIEPMLDKPSFVQSDVYRGEDSLFSWYLREINDINRPFPVGPFDISVGINGFDGVKYVDRLPTSTSTGFPHGGPKIKHLIDLEPQVGHSVHRGLDEVLKKEYNNIKDCYIRGVRPAIVFDSNFKDEPVSQSKIDKQKCRIFNAGPCAFTILFRQYYLWIIPYVSGKYRHLFGMGIGANAYSLDWKVLYDHVIRHGDDRVIAGDYSNFDKRMSAQLISSAFNVLIRICKEKGWSDEDILIMRGLATDICYPLTNVFGLLLETDGSNPSGHPLTTVINGMCNILYMMLACMDIERCQKINKIDYKYFTNYFSILTYGDDNIGSISKDVPYINHSTISAALSKYGVLYTMADKSSESRPFISITEADFLKRKFVKDLHFEGHVGAPLAEESIIKMLTTIVVSDSISLEEQTAAVIDSACREYFQYPREIFEVRRKWLLDLCDKHNLRPYLPGNSLLRWKTRLNMLKEDYGVSIAQDYNEWEEIVDNWSDYSIDDTISIVSDNSIDRIVRLSQRKFSILHFVPCRHYYKYQICMIELLLDSDYFDY